MTGKTVSHAVSHEHLKSVVHRRGSLTKDDYREAISDLARAMVQDEVRHICCSVCSDTGHTAETCHHNPLLLARQWSQATAVWVCYHCGSTATNDAEAREHFGASDLQPAQCQHLSHARAAIEALIICAEQVTDDDGCIRSHAKGAIRNGLAALEQLTNSSPAHLRTPHNSGEREPSVMPASGAGEGTEQLIISHRPEGS